jgi:hypothetical protein
MTTAAPIEASEYVPGPNTMAGLEALQAEDTAAPQTIAKKLRKDMAACRIQRGKCGVRKKLDRQQVRQAAATFNADERQMSASKLLIDGKAEAYRRCNSLIAEAIAYWHSITIPFPERGIRLIRRDRVEEIVAEIAKYRQALEVAAAELDAVYATLVESAREKLGTLFNEDDYPAAVGHLFRLELDFPSVEPPNYLLQLSPKLYEAEAARIQARFEEAVRLTEQAFVEKFGELVSHLADRLQFGEDGKPKTFQASTVDNLLEFFQQFGQLNIGSNSELEKLISDAKAVIGEHDADSLRKNAVERQTVQASMAELATKIDALMIDRPTRQFALDEE